MLKRFVVALLSLLFLAAVTAAPVQDVGARLHPNPSRCLVTFGAAID